MFFVFKKKQMTLHEDEEFVLLPNKDDINDGLVVRLFVVGFVERFVS